MSLFELARAFHRASVPIVVSIAFVVPMPSRASGTGTAGSCTASTAEYEVDGDRRTLESLSAFPEAGGTKVIAKANDYVTKAKACTTATQGAQSVCIEGCSTTLLAANAGATAIARNTEGTSTANASTNAAAVAMEQQAKGFKAFAAECAPKRGACEKACTEALTALDELNKAVNAVHCEIYLPSSERVTACTATLGAAKTGMQAIMTRETNATDFKARAGKKAECTGKLANNEKKATDNMKSLMTAAAAALGSALTNSASGSGSSTPTQTASVSSGLDCAGQDAGTQTCICKENPRACEQQLASVGQIGALPGTVGVATASGGGSSKSNLESATSVSSGGSIGPEGDPSLLAMGGSESLEGGGTAKAASKDAPANARYLAATPNLFNGEAGGSGGFSSTDDVPSSTKAGITPLSRSGRGFLGGSAGTGYVGMGLTTSSGRSNWEKVRTRYYENSGTLVREELKPPPPPPIKAK